MDGGDLTTFVTLYISPRDPSEQNRSHSQEFLTCACFDGDVLQGLDQYQRTLALAGLTASRDDHHRFNARLVYVDPSPKVAAPKPSAIPVGKVPLLSTSDSSQS